MKKKSPFSAFGRIIVQTGMFRLYKNGGSFGFLVRWWHPLSWIYAPLVFIASVLFVGFPETWKDRHDIGFRMNPWFVKNPDRLEWTTLKEIEESRRHHG